MTDDDGALVAPDPYHNLLHRRLLAEHVDDAAARFASGALLDIGAGTRPYESLFGSRVDSYTALDVEDRGGADVIGSALDLPFDDESFDTVVSFQVLEHVPDPFRMVAEAARVLRPGGHLIFTVPFSWPIHEAPNDYFRFTEFGIRELVRRAGTLEVVEIRPMGGLWASLGTRVSYFLWERSRRKGRLNRRLCLFVQRQAASLDARYPDDTATHNYTLVARKVGTSGA